MDSPASTPVPNVMVAVRWEPCGEYDADADCTLGTCVRCGWPYEEHGTEVPWRSAA